MIWTLFNLIGGKIWKRNIKVIIIYKLIMSIYTILRKMKIKMITRRISRAVKLVKVNKDNKLKIKRIRKIRSSNLMNFIDYFTYVNMNLYFYCTFNKIFFKIFF